MAIIKIECTSCGGRIEFDDSRDKGFCMFCGAQFFKEQVMPSVQSEQTSTDANLAVRARALYNEKDYRGAIGFAQKALEQNPNNKDAQNILNSIFLISGKFRTVEEIREIDKLVFERFALIKNNPFPNFKLFLSQDEKQLNKAYKQKLTENKNKICLSIGTFYMPDVKLVIDVVATGGWQSLRAHLNLHLLDQQQTALNTTFE